MIETKMGNDNDRDNDQDKERSPNPAREDIGAGAHGAGSPCCFYRENEEVIRIISARKATRNEREQYGSCS